MAIKVTLEFDSVADMLGFFGQARPDKAVQKPAPTPAPTAAPAAASSAPATPAASPASSPAPAGSPASGARPVEYAELQKAMFKLAAVSKDEARALNAKFGVVKASELAEDRRWEMLDAAVAKTAELTKGAS